METKQMWTPGPWVIEHRPNANGVDTSMHIVTPDDGEMGWSICRVHNFCGAHGMPDNSESEANAKLIACAPDLLSALKDLVQTERDQADPGLYVLALDKAEEVIARVEGR